MNSLTQLEKNLYNTYLHASRTTRGKPFNSRKDFSNISEEDCFTLKKITNFFNRFPHIKVEYYFRAPYIIYEDQEHFKLDFFAKMSAVKAYTIYMKQIQEKDPDSPEQIQFITDSLKFIGMFCIKNNILLEQYPTFQTGITYNWMKHIKENYISVYSIMEFPNVFEVLKEVPKDEKELFLGKEDANLYLYKIRYLKSTTAKYLVQEGIKRINKHVTLKK